MPSNFKATTKCFLEIEVAGNRLGQLIFNLHTDICPKTCENFRCLCTGEKGTSRSIDRPLHYKNSTFHRVVKGFIIQGGDFTLANGKGGESIYGGPFEDENFILKHDKPYLLSMANRGKNTNKSQFFITTAPASHLDGVHVVFGELIVGFDLVREIENQPVDSKSRPIHKIVIVNCGEIKQESTVSSGHIGKRDEVEESSSKRLLPKKYSSRRESLSPSLSGHSLVSSRSLSISSSSSSTSSSSSSSSSDSSSPFSSSSESSSSSGSSNCDSTSSHSPNSSSISSSSSYSTDESYRASRTRNKKNRNSSHDEKEGDKTTESKDDENDIILEVAKTKGTEDEREYPCSVKPDEIPQVPMNKFLFRPIFRASTNKDSAEDQEECDPIEVDRDLSRYQDRDNDSEHDNSTNNSNNLKSLSSAVATVEKSSRVSRSGRIMKGRGSFKFRTPSPDSRRSIDHYDERSRRSRSPHQYRNRDHRKFRHDDNRDQRRSYHNHRRH